MSDSGDDNVARIISNKPQYNRSVRDELNICVPPHKLRGHNCKRPAVTQYTATVVVKQKETQNKKMRANRSRKLPSDHQTN